MSTHDSDGKRTKYFEDDDNIELKTLVSLLLSFIHI